MDRIDNRSGGLGLERLTQGWEMDVIIFFFLFDDDHYKSRDILYVIIQTLKSSLMDEYPIMLVGVVTNLGSL